MTILERIQSYKNELLGELQPERASEILKELSALVGNIGDEILRTEVEYNKVLMNWLDREKTANRAKIQAGITEEYIAMRTAKNTEKVANEMIRALKYFLKVKEREYESLKYQ